MPKYGILKSSTNTGDDDELLAVFAAPLSIVSNKPLMMTETVTLKRRTAYTDTQRWEIETAIVPFTNASDFLVKSVVVGHSGSIFVRMPQIYGRTLVSGTVKTFSDATEGSEYVYVTGPRLASGEFIKFHGHQKVYLISEVTPMTDAVKLKIFPKLTGAVGTDEVVSFGSKVTMTAQFSSDTPIGISYTDGILAEVKNMVLIESL